MNAYLGGSPTVDITMFHVATTTSNGENYSDAAAGSRPGGNATDKVTGAIVLKHMTLTAGSLLLQQLLPQQCFYNKC